MSSDLTPDQVRAASFRSTLRGWDSSEVGDFLQQLASQIEALSEERDRLKDRLAEVGQHDLKDEFDSIGREVSAVLQAAREAAESMRERASLDAARWRAEAMAEAERARKDARNDAEALRGDAWTTGTEMLNQTTAEVKKRKEDAEREVLTIMGEAEREAHRLVSTARRESEDLIRGATMDAEKISSEAAKRRDEMIDSALRQAESAQERTRALEERRAELLEELENVRSTLSSLEGSLEKRRDDLNLSSSDFSSVKIVPAAPVEVDIADWTPGETVRVVPPDRDVVAEAPPQPPPKAKGPVSGETPVTKPPEQEEAAKPETKPSLNPTETEATPASKPGDDVEALFAALRGEDPPSADPIESVDESVAAGSGDDGHQVGQGSDDAATGSPVVKPGISASSALDDRDRLLLPISNRALRGVKKAVTEAQNLALDSLRTNDEWSPEPSALADTVRADLIGLWAESFSAGHSAAEEMTGKRRKRPATPPSTAAEDFGGALATDLAAALAETGEGQRERQAAASKVFRGWRTDEAERRIRELALGGYHLGIAQSHPGSLEWVAAGTPCSACKAAAKSPADNPPPVHPGCGCTLVVRL